MSRSEFVSRVCKNNGRSLLYMFYECYRHGVVDAAELDDENQCREYVRFMRSAHIYKILGMDYELHWKEWRIRMMLYIERIPYRERLRKFLIDIDSYGTYYSVALRAGMDFYVLGADDFLKYPVSTMIEQFRYETHYRRWQKGFEMTVYRNAGKLNTDLQILLFDRARYDMEIVVNNAKGADLAMTQTTYLTFMDAIYRSVFKIDKPEKDETE